MKRIKPSVIGILLSVVILFISGVATAAVHYVPTDDEFVVSGVTVGISDISRIPILPPNAPNANSFSVQVTLTPSPLPSGESVKLELSNVVIGSDGSAVFDDGSQSGTSTMTISQTSRIIIRGVKNSNEKDNIMLSASIGTIKLDEEVFSVRTWPTNFRQIQGYDDGNGHLKYKYDWDSESGNEVDLYGIKIGEIVYYNEGEGVQISCGEDQYFRPPSPPYGGPPFPPNICDWKDYYYVKNPFVRDIMIDGTISNPNLDDDHGFEDWGPTGQPFRKDYIEHVFIATQYYRFKDPVLMKDASTYENLIGPIYIRRNIFQDLGVWKYRIEKSGGGYPPANAEINLP